MNHADLAALAIKHADYISNLIERGVDVISYKCPTCKGNIDTRAAAGEIWDTLSICPHCGDMHMKITDGYRATAVTVPA